MKKILSLFLPAALLSLAASFLVCLYAPVSIYLLNIDEFSYDVYDLLGMMAPVFLAALAVLLVFFFLAAALLRRKERIFHVLTGLLFAVFLAAYVQGTFLSGNLPPLTGDAIDWSLYSAQRIPSLLLWIGLTVGVFFLFRRFAPGKILTVTSGFLTAMLFLSLLLTAFTSDGFRDKTDYVPTYAGINELSSDQNLIILLLDIVDGDKYDELKATHPEYSDIFEDFTYYSNTLGAYPYTSRSIPFIITGQWYENQTGFYPYTNEAYSTFPLLSRLKSENFKVNLYEAELMLSEETMQLFDNTSSAGEGASFLYPLGFYKVQAKLVGYRYLPFDLKPLCEQSPAKIANSTQRLNGSDLRFDGDNSYFYQEVCTADFTATDRPVYSFIHLHGAHSPYEYLSDVSLSGDANYTSSVEACFTMAGAYLDALRAAGLYDNSAIIVMADHGINESVPLDSEDSTGRQHPILFIKGIGETHPYAESAAPVSFADLQDAYFSLLDGNTGSDVFPFGEDAVRERRYLRYNLYDFTLYEYLQNGLASDDDSLVPTGVVYPE